MLAGACDGEFAPIQQVLDREDLFDLLAGVETLARGGPFGADFRELRLPEPQDVSRHPCDLADFPDFKIELVGDGRRVCG